MRGEEMSGKKKGTVSNLFEKMMEGLGKRELIISLLIMLAAILAIIVLFVLKKTDRKYSKKTVASPIKKPVVILIEMLLVFKCIKCRIPMPCN